jgi:hypothetical protein
MAFIYKITNDVNGKVYIGKTLHSVEKRWKEHIKDSKREHNENRPLYRAMNKYGIDNFHIETIEECVEELVEEREVFWIKEYNSFGKNGYNATIGGDGKSYVHRALILWFWLGNMTSKSIKKLTGYDGETIRKVLKSYGVTDKELQDRGKVNLKPVAMYNIDNEHIKDFKSITDACNFLNTDPRHSHIGSVCEGKRKTAHGYRWKYL